MNNFIRLSKLKTVGKDSKGTELKHNKNTKNMKKKIFGAALIAVMAVAASWNFNQNKNEVNLTDLAFANVEALAGGEIPGWNDYYVEKSWDNNAPPRIQTTCYTGGSSPCA